jgi:hypothetical protein
VVAVAVQQDPAVQGVLVVKLVLQLVMVVVVVVQEQ